MPHERKLFDYISVSLDLLWDAEFLEKMVKTGFRFATFTL
uniref:Uncharacterized protein n=1 Tax=Pseudomonas syringae pv. actinidiae TaxID=103796 RepID=A0A2P0QIN7_PSESF|nr:hypothetical protein [Pseudomonas syringae pv. actinidiae]